MLELTDNDVEETTCINCGGSEYFESDDIEWKSQNLRYRICNRCGLKYMGRRPTSEWLSTFYSKGFWQEKLKNQGYQEKQSGRSEIVKAKGLRQKIRNHKRRAKRIAGILDSQIPPKSEIKVLEIGAGFGQTLVLLRKLYRADICAVEPNEEARVFLTANRVPLVGKWAEDLDSITGARQFDVIIMSHVLENLSSPVRALKLVVKHLRQGGLCYVDTTNLYYRNDCNPYHMAIFTPESLERMLSQAGFRTVKSHHEDNPRAAKDRGEVNALDPYLSVVAQRDVSKGKHSIESPVDTSQIVADQQMGEAYFRASAARTRLLNKRLHKRILSKLRAIFNLPKPVVLAKEQRRG